MRGAGASGAEGEGLSEGVGLLMAGVHGTAEPEADREGIAAEGEGWLMVRVGGWQECGQRQWPLIGMRLWRRDPAIDGVCVTSRCS